MFRHGVRLFVAIGFCASYVQTAFYALASTLHSLQTADDTYEAASQLDARPIGATLIRAAMGFGNPFIHRKQKDRVTIHGNQRAPNSDNKAAIFSHLGFGVHRTLSRLTHGNADRDMLRMHFRAMRFREEHSTSSTSDDAPGSSSITSSRRPAADPSAAVGCPSDQFGRECSGEGSCNSQTGECECQPKTNLFSFLDLQSSRTTHFSSGSSSRIATRYENNPSEGMLKGGTRFGESCQYQACPLGPTSTEHPEGRPCNDQGACNRVTGRCMCFPGWVGLACDTDPLSTYVFDLRCEQMDDHYIAQCIRATASGACIQYQLEWDSLCFKTCAALQGKTCQLQQRKNFCAHDPDCEELCLRFFDVNCNRYVQQHPDAGGVTYTDQVYLNSSQSAQNSKALDGGPTETIVPTPQGYKKSGKAYAIHKAGNNYKAGQNYRAQIHNGMDEEKRADFLRVDGNTVNGSPGISVAAQKKRIGATSSLAQKSLSASKSGYHRHTDVLQTLYNREFPKSRGDDAAFGTVKKRLVARSDLQPRLDQDGTSSAVEMNLQGARFRNAVVDASAQRPHDGNIVRKKRRRRLLRVAQKDAYLLHHFFSDDN